MKTDGFAGFSADVAERLRRAPRVDTVVPMRFADGAIAATVEPGALDVKTVGSSRSPRT